jgi:DNA-binding response OmpR family regulator
MHVLLVEDDPMIGRSLARALKDAGMTLDWIRDGVQGLAAAESGDYALVLLDLGLPKKSGFDVLKSMREQGDATPLLIITARDEIDNLVSGLDLGADDYLIKPFGFKELMARMRAVMRRHANYAVSSVSNGEIMLDMATHEATYRGKTVTLSAKEFSLLHALTEHPGTILSRSQIEERLYGWNEEIESNVVDVLIFYLRKKFDNQIIRNVRGIGWMVVKHPT